MQITTIGLDIAKNVFQVHGIGVGERVVVMRDLLLRQRTQTINALRAHLAELGITAVQGREGLKDLLAIVADERDERLPINACDAASADPAVQPT
jgi:transposase